MWWFIYTSTSGRICSDISQDMECFSISGSFGIFCVFDIFDWISGTKLTSMFSDAKTSYRLTKDKIYKIFFQGLRRRFPQIYLRCQVSLIRSLTWDNLSEMASTWYLRNMLGRLASYSHYIWSYGSCWCEVYKGSKKVTFSNCFPDDSL